MIIRKLNLLNWKCFKGETNLKLGPKVYAVVAQRMGDSESSNWAGKSSLLEAIDYGLYGRLSKSVRTEDAWITRGEDSGGVELEFDNGASVVRSRKRGKSTQLTFDGGTGRYKQKEAQLAINAMLELSEEDFAATCYFEQKKLSKLVTMDPGQRMDTIAAWFRLELLQSCEESVRDKTFETIAAIAQVRQEASVRKFQVDSIIASYGAERDPAYYIAERLYSITSLHKTKEEELEAAQEEEKRRAALKHLEAQAQRYEELVSLGKSLKAGLGNVEKEEFDARNAEEVARKTHTSWVQAHKKVEEKRMLAAGDFDGLCPLIQRPCPSKDFVNGQVGLHRVQLKEFLETEQRLEKIYEERDEESKSLSKIARETRKEHDRLAYMREEARRLKPLHEQYQSIDKASLSSGEGRVRKLQQECQELWAEKTALEGDKARLAEATKALKEFADNTKCLERELATLREAVIIFGKNGAQRTIAERALEEIEAGANELLKACSIPLVVEIQWSREGQGLASVCGTCGSPFPTSAKAKACSKCSAERGPNIINKLEVVLSDRSGAAEDLAGGALQLSASAWLRRDRTSDWSVALIDEPFGSLDASNRRAFASHLVSMLKSQYGFNQSFVIAHHSSVLDSLPGRIEILNDGQYSTAKVVA